ncbi:MAG: ribosomal protein L16 Arg81 hydroxylase [Flavobacteriales bacterium]|jgi:ribosomal protein L16 Arg81 hydroxylase
MKIKDFRTVLDNGPLEESPAFVASNGKELDQLIHPISREEFVGSYFSKTSLNVEGLDEKFDQIFSWERLRHALKRGEKITDKRYNIKASFTAGEDSGNPSRLIDAYHNQVIELLNAGATICITNIQMADPDLARWAEAIRAQLNFSGTIGLNCYISPDGSGLPMHYDKRVATSIQIAGKKRWRYSTKSAKAWPNTNEVYQEGKSGNEVGTLPPNMEIREVELSPGDVLCLPAGAWHSARGIGCSLALNLFFSPRNYLEQFMPMLQNFATSNVEWRGGPPASLEKIQGTIPEEVSSYMRERLDEFHQVALEAIGGPGALIDPWLTSLTHAPYSGWEPTEIKPISDVASNQAFCIAVLPLRYIEFQNRLIIPCENALHRFPVSLGPILQQISAEGVRFTIPEILSRQQKANGLAPHEITHYMKVLYKVGIIKKA